MVLPEDEDQDKVWKESDLKYLDSFSETDPDDAGHARVLEVINEYLPVKEMAGRPIHVPVLRQFGLVENEKLDDFLAIAFGTPQKPDEGSMGEPKGKRKRPRAKPARLDRRTNRPTGNQTRAEVLTFVRTSISKNAGADFISSTGFHTEKVCMLRACAGRKFR